MKKVILLGLVMFSYFSFAQKRVIKFEELPSNSMQFIKKHFSKSPVTSVIKDDEITDIDYKVILNDGTKISFDRNGEWDEIDSMNGKIPAALIPEKISSYVNANYKGFYITSIDKGFRKYKIELSNGLDLEFDKQGNFLRIDD